MINPEVTICVLTYGNYTALAQRCINSIIAMCPAGDYKLVVGANEVNEETKHYLTTLHDRGLISELIISDKNLNKCPMMKLMFRNIQTAFIWWFDDDSYITDADAFRQRVETARNSPDNTVMWGHQFYFGNENDFSYGTDVISFIKNASWYKGLEPPSWKTGGKNVYEFDGKPSGDGRWFFLTGGCWFIRHSVIKLLNWPDSNLIKRNDDVFLCEAIRQQGYLFQDTGTAGVAINTEMRRGEGEDKKTMELQVLQSQNQPDLDGWFFTEEKDAYQQMVRSIKNGRIAEVGVWKGLSLSTILEICRENNNEVYAIDPWMPIQDDGDYSESLTNDIYGIFCSNMKILGYENKIHIIRKKSADAADEFEDESLDLVFIDADHAYDSVCTDIEKWWKKLRKGGILCGHDFTFKEGVCRAVSFYFHDCFELAGGSIWKVVKNNQALRVPFISGKPKGNGCLFIPTFGDPELLEENYANRHEVSSRIDIVVVDDNYETEANKKVRILCSENNWTYLCSGRSIHGNWQDHYHDGSGFNHFIWKYFVELGKQYDYVIKMDTDAYITDPEFFVEMDYLLYNKRASAGTIEYRTLSHVGSFWDLEGVKKYAYKPSFQVPHLQGGIYGLSKSALKEIGDIGFFEGIHQGFSEDGYMSYVCMLLGIPMIPVNTTGSWYHPYIPELKTISGLKAIHPLTKSVWENFAGKGQRRYLLA